MKDRYVDDLAGAWWHYEEEASEWWADLPDFTLVSARNPAEGGVSWVVYPRVLNRYGLATSTLRRGEEVGHRNGRWAAARAYRRWLVELEEEEEASGRLSMSEHYGPGWRGAALDAIG